jgi:hypothetical protein
MGNQLVYLVLKNLFSGHASLNVSGLTPTQQAHIQQIINDILEAKNNR